MKRRVKGSLMIAFVAIGLAAFVWASTHRDPPPVATMTVRGRIAKRLVRNGDWVRRGQLVAVLDSRNLEEELAEAERELKSQQSRAQAAIEPLFPDGGITGMLPETVPDPESVEIPAKPPPQAKPRPDPVTEDDQAVSERDIQVATTEVAQASAAAEAARAVRDALEPKLSKAQVDADLATNKTAPAAELFAQGAISRKRLEALQAAGAAATKVVKELQDQLVDAEKAFSDAQLRVGEANARLDQATKARELVVLRLPRRETSPAQRPTPKATRPRKVIGPRGTPTITSPMRAFAIPLRVNVDSVAMKASQMKVRKLEQKIAGLRASIAARRLRAPASGRIDFDGVGLIQIRQAP